MSDGDDEGNGENNDDSNDEGDDSNDEGDDSNSDVIFEGLEDILIRKDIRIYAINLTQSSQTQN